jgi:hypothetical protein
MSISGGFSLELFFLDGKPDGMLTAQVFNWTGLVLMAPRTRLKEALARKEAAYTGVYILLGDQEGQPLTYIGEAEEIAARIKTHEAKSDWWHTAVLITSSANILNKAHAKYLEAHLVEQAKKAARTLLANGNTPPTSGLSEASRVNMEGFLDYLTVVLPALRVDIFMSKTVASTTMHAADAQVRFELASKKHGLKATATLTEGEFVIEAGSTARLQWEGVGTEDSGYAMLHARLRKSGVLADAEGHSVFTQNYSFNSPSAAAAIIYGRNANGPLEWKVFGSGGSYKQWEAQQLQTSQPADQ